MFRLKDSKTEGEILIPTSIDKTETTIIGAAIETIERIGPCNAKVRVEKIEDVRISKRSFVIERAKELLKELTGNVLPDSQEITDEVAQSVRMMEIVEYGEGRVAAGPAIDESEEIILVEGRADVLNLLKQGIKNCIALDGTRIPESIKELSKKKTVTVFVDGDRGGDLIIKGLIDAGVEVDFVAKASAGKEVEEITKKEVFKSLRGKITLEQAKAELTKDDGNGSAIASVEFRKPESRKYPEKTGYSRPSYEKPAYGRTSYSKPSYGDKPSYSEKPSYERTSRVTAKKASPVEMKKFKELLDDLVGTRGAYLLDSKLNTLGKIPGTELFSTIKDMTNIYAIVLDGFIDRSLTSAAEPVGVQYIIATHSKVKPSETKITLVSPAELASSGV